jgi:acetyltransferase-like isoleucine patch superfamily enzyme
MALHRRLREHFRSKWRRVIPFYEEVLGDAARWDKAQFLGFGEGSSIYESSYVYGDVKVGKGTWIGPFTILDGSGGLSIGDYCSISSGVQIYTHETVEWALTGGKAKYKYAPVSIGNCCFIGSLTVVRMGVKIGDHVLVGAHSFVNKNLPDNSIAVGCPARIIGKIEVKNDAVEYIGLEKNCDPSRLLIY